MGKKKNAEAVLADATTTTSETPTETTSEPQAGATTATEEPPIDTDPPKPKKGGKKKRVGSVATLADLAAAYATHMEDEGKSEGTIASYKMELKTAMGELGEETQVTDLTHEKIEAYFKCRKVTKLKSGKNKSQLSVDKTRRVLRLALVWAAERGIIEKAPIPEASS